MFQSKTRNFDQILAKFCLKDPIFKQKCREKNVIFDPKFCSKTLIFDQKRGMSVFLFKKNHEFGNVFLEKSKFSTKKPEKLFLEKPIF